MFLAMSEVKPKAISFNTISDSKIPKKPTLHCGFVALAARKKKDLSETQKLQSSWKFRMPEGAPKSLTGAFACRLMTLTT